MRGNAGFVLFFMAVLIVVGCGGSGSDQSSSLTFDIALLEVEEEHLIQGTVYNDLNGDGVMDLCEPGIAGVTVSLAGMEDTVTDSMGMYSFGVTVSRAYTITATDPMGFISTTPNEVVVEVLEGDVTVDFGDQSEEINYSIYGVVYDDLNGDGVMDMDEPGIPGVLVTLEGVADIMTRMDGSYAFAVADTGCYTVIETDPDGYISTTPNEVVVDIIDMNVQVDFGDRYVKDIDVDVKPGSEINPLNLRSKGVLPVAILGSETVDVTQIDPATILLNGVPPLRWSYKDVCVPDGMTMDDDMNSDDDEMSDGYVDMTLKFSTQEIAQTVGDVQRGDIVTLTMTGSLFDGMLASGEETVWIVQAPK